MASFAPLSLPVNENGWGPSSLPSKFTDTPYATFNKGERLGRIADWSQNAVQQRHGQHQRGNAAAQVPNAPGPFAFKQVDDEDSFVVVDTRSAQKPKSFVSRPRFNPNYRGNERNRQDDRRGGGRDGQRGQGRDPRQNDKSNYNREQRKREQPTVREPSVEIGSQWEECDQVTFSDLQKLKCSKPESTTLREYGQLRSYDRSYDRVTTKAEKKILKDGKKVIKQLTTTDDTVIRELCNSEEDANVFATDTILAALMAAQRSSLPWDVVVTKIQGKLFFDKREDSPLDFVTVSETAKEAPTDEPESGINGSTVLAQEATGINTWFANQILSKTAEKHEMEDGEWPLASEETSDHLAYRYRMFEIDDDITVVARCGVDGVMAGKDGATQFLSIKALNEFDPKVAGVDWRKQLDSQRGAVLATEMRNNASKVARWCMAALLADVDQIKMGYVSRVSPKDNSRHTILGTQFYRPNDFATQMNLSETTCWGVLRFIIKMVLEKEDGKYVLMKDPNKPMLRLYSVPLDTFDE